MPCNVEHVGSSISLDGYYCVGTLSNQVLQKQLLNAIVRLFINRQRLSSLNTDNTNKIIIAKHAKHSNIKKINTKLKYLSLTVKNH